MPFVLVILKQIKTFASDGENILYFLKTSL